MNYTYALITARKNSKGIKNKNLKKIGNYSLIELAEKNYRKISQIKKIFISSDSRKILNKTSRETIKILRPRNISNDNSKSEQVVFHFLRWIKKNNIIFPNYLFIVQPTSPFVSKRNILKSLNLIKKKKCGSVTSIYQVPHKYNILNHRISKKNNMTKFLYEKERKKKFNRQLKLDTFVHGNIFLINVKKFIKQKIILSIPNYAVKIKSFKEAIDIDTETDLKLARLIKKNKI
ncbi:MAG: hypothetical protein CBE33_07030 [Candidatus Pelagibacter sp. TMED273]|nr:MAG: hypothetical protein CBE33_07030 [Candidatus Pelagibacter sp. TMED273]|tara:strand:+ start:5534 stop:6232 length:699 start_codon:yes stop_codon:yes gene_type:complete